VKIIRYLVCVPTLLILSSNASCAQAPPRCPNAPAYGNDANAGHIVKVNGIALYYEAHGDGSPLLLIHGNGGAINSVRCQIAYFSKYRLVIIADSRSHGRSEDGNGRLTYEQIADDLSSLLLALKIDALDVWGHSDGGIVALLLAIRHPQQVRRVVASSANLRPDETALTPAFLKSVATDAQTAADMIRTGDQSRNWTRRKRQLDLMLEEPHIQIGDLQRITAPMLVMAADGDIIPLAHTLEIATNIPRAQLFIMPGSTHGLPHEEHEFYNMVVARFLDRQANEP
jgi:pimeloyl-ACP methyl ester carboxylesterase